MQPSIESQRVEWIVHLASGRAARFTSYNRRTIVGDAIDPEDSVQSIELERQLDDDWRIRIGMRVQDRALVLAPITIEPLHEDISVWTSTIWRRLKMGDAPKLVRDTLPLLAGMLPGDLMLTKLQLPHPGQAGYSPRWYAELVQRYLAACGERPPAPIALLLDEEGVAGDDRRRRAAWWRARLKAAERQGILTGRPTGTEGKAGGRLTAKGRRLLAGREA